MNTTTIVGRVGADAVLKEVNKSKVVNFSVGTNKTYKNNEGQKITKTTWFECALWGARAEAVAPFIKKGTLVSAQGEVSADYYTDKENNTKAILRLTVGDLTLEANPTAAPDMSFPELPEIK